MKPLLLLFTILTLIVGKAQETEIIPPSFNDTRLLNLHTTELLAEKTLQFRIGHRFGAINSGVEEFWGFDQATMRIAFEYGIKDWLMIGLGRSSYEKTYDGFVKFSLKKQDANFPLSIVWHSNIMINSLPDYNDRKDYFSSRLSFSNQLILSRRFNDNFSFMLTPSHVHINLVPKESDPNDLFALGFGGTYSITRVTSFIAEYNLRVEKNGSALFDPFYNSFSIGAGFKTKGHFFSLSLSNSLPLFERGFIFETVDSWSDGSIHLGFNLIRNFNL